jgi:hypothetical protein
MTPHRLTMKPAFSVQARSVPALGRSGVLLAGILGDQRSDLLVLVRPAGTGGYLSACAFVVEKQQLTMLAAVGNLPPDADPVASLRTAIGPPR